jgi:hypothetical protein
MPDTGGTRRSEPTSRKYSTDYRLYLEETFTEFRESFQDIKQNQDKFNTKLDEIVKQTTATNGRVLHLEEYKTKADKIIETRVTPDMFGKLCTCAESTEKKVNELDEDLTEYRLIKRNPKLSIAILLVVLIAVGISAIGAIRSIGVDIRDKDLNQRIEKIEHDIGEINKKLNGNV